MVAVITGATKGIGRAVAFALAKQGYNLSLCARNEADLLALKLALEDLDVRAMVQVVDCANKAEVQRFCQQTMAFFGTADVLVNNVGLYLPGSLLAEDDTQFEAQWNVNVMATYVCSKFFGNYFKQQQKGHVFNVCSVASYQPVANAASYSVTKAAMLSLNHVLRAELGPFNVKVTAVVPGATFTASWEGTDVKQEELVQADDVASAMVTALKLSAGANLDEIKITPLNF